MSDSSNLFEISGHIMKEEVLHATQKSIIHGTLVLETKTPFSGYYSQTPSENAPITFFLFTKKDYPIAEIERASAKIKNYLKIDFDAAKAEVVYHNSVHTCIRLYYLQDTSLLEIIQKAFIDEGIKMKNKSSYEGKALITTKKVFLLEDAGNGIYINKGKSSMFYFTISKALNWSEFASVSNTVKNNWNGSFFDAALGVFQRRKGIEEVVRIYSPEIDIETCKELQKLYQTAIDNL